MGGGLWVLAIAGAAVCLLSLADNSHVCVSQDENKKLEKENAQRETEVVNLKEALGSQEDDFAKLEEDKRASKESDLEILKKSSLKLPTAHAEVLSLGFARVSAASPHILLPTTFPRRSGSPPSPAGPAHHHSRSECQVRNRTQSCSPTAPASCRRQGNPYHRKGNTRGTTRRGESYVSPE